MPVSRRSFLNTSPLVFAPSLWSATGWQAPPGVARSGADRVDPSFPAQPPELVREMVGVAHGNLVRVKELLARHRTLALATWDWGFGDWEDALGAASHVGNRDIAETLLAHGARPTIFSAAMLGQLDAVKALISAAPGIEATPGPHGITLLRHALAGGPRAEAVAEYLKALPGADARPASTPISPEQLAELAGQYVYGPGSSERIAIAVSKNTLTFTREGHIARGLTHVGDRAFFPVGAPSVRIAFRPTAEGMTLTIHDPDLILEARRVGS
jgi:hypothetical protein